MLSLIRTAFKGPSQARAAHREALKQEPGIKTGVEQLEHISLAKPGDNSDAPIFLLSAGWRSGSTLLQRLIMSDSRVMIWGEPYDECGLIQAMANSTQAFRANWPPDDYYYDGSPPNSLAGDWIANLFPSANDFHQAHRAFFDTLFAVPCEESGAVRWGIKEVRLGTEHCAYLRWLYPQARFILLHRNPLDAYRSYSRYGRSWYNTFPDQPVFTPTQFGQHWKTLVEGFVRDADMLDALIIPYEDLISDGQVITKLEDYLDISIDRRVLSDKVGSSNESGKRNSVNWLERRLLKRAVSPTARELGYNW